MPEFRWILLGLGLLLLAGIWWSGRRGASQARGVSNLRDANLRDEGAGGGRGAFSDADAPEPTPPVSFPVSPLQREASISPYEPLRISSADAPPAERSMSIPVLNHPHEDSEVLQLDDVQLLHENGMARQDPVEISLEGEPFAPLADLEATDDVHPAAAPARDSGARTAASPEATAAEPLVDTAQHRVLSPPPASAAAAASSQIRPAPQQAASPPAPDQPQPPEAQLSSGRFSRPREPRPAPRTDISGRFARVKPEAPKPIELQKIITLRVLSMAEDGWQGEDVAAALAGSDLVHGRYGVFHRLHTDGRTVFYVASLVEPGSFDPALMPEQQFPGLSIFAVLPGPMEPVATLDLLYSTARQLATDLSGMMQDELGNPLSPQRAAQLREGIVTFQHQLQAASAP